MLWQVGGIGRTGLDWTRKYDRLNENNGWSKMDMGQPMCTISTYIKIHAYIPANFLSKIYLIFSFHFLSTSLSTIFYHYLSVMECSINLRYMAQWLF